MHNYLWAYWIIISDNYTLMKFVMACEGDLCDLLCTCSNFELEICLQIRWPQTSRC
jgi:hypothetical protein